MDKEIKASDYMEGDKLNIKKVSSESITNIAKLLDDLEERYPITPRVTSEQIKRFSIKENRIRKELPETLPTFGLLPLPIDEHECIGLYESKQNLYLITAHSYNRLVQLIKALEARVAVLEKKK